EPHHDAQGAQEPRPLRRRPRRRRRGVPARAGARDRAARRGRRERGQGALAARHRDVRRDRLDPDPRLHGVPQRGHRGERRALRHRPEARRTLSSPTGETRFPAWRWTVPRRVDHDQRRLEIVEAAWRLIARGGFAAATMREIAAEAGFANGALKYYFESKDDLLVAAFQHTFYRVNERAARAIGDRTGLEAIRLLCLEMLPLDEERRVESRVAVAFWDRASSSPQLRKVHADSF